MGHESDVNVFYYKNKLPLNGELHVARGKNDRLFKNRTLMLTFVDDTILFFGSHIVLECSAEHT